MQEDTSRQADFEIKATSFEYFFHIFLKMYFDKEIAWGYFYKWIYYKNNDINKFQCRVNYLLLILNVNFLFCSLFIVSAFLLSKINKNSLNL